MTTLIIGSVWGMTPRQLADALSPADPALCGWLDGSCTLPHAPGSWLCEVRHATVSGRQAR